MAKNSILGVMTGKLGNMVGYRNQASATNDKQAWRVYQPNVSNPRSTAQANQRMLLAPATKFYSSLDGILSRSWQGVKYGNDSRREFLRRALLHKNGPYVPKGTMAAVPADYEISDGTLVPVSITDISPLASGSGRVYGAVAHTDIFLKAKPADAKMGTLAAQIIAGNTDIKEGDQLTFVVVRKYKESFIYSYFSWIVDTTDDRYPERVSNLVTIIDTEYNGTQCVAFQFNNVADDESLVAAAVILSRDWDKPNGGLRSPAKLFISDEVVNEYFTDAAYRLALASYTNDEQPTTGNDWPTEEIVASTNDAVAEGDNSARLVAKAMRFLSGEQTSDDVAVLALVKDNTTFILYRTQGGIAYPVGTNGVALDVRHVPADGEGEAVRYTLNDMKAWAAANGVEVGYSQYYARYGTIA